MAALVCIGLWALMRAGAAAAYRDSGEVTAVVDGDRPGTVVVRTWRDGRADLWLADDTGEPVDWLDPSAPAGGAPQTRQCLGELCYRVPGGTLRVEQSTDGGATFATVWEVGGSRYTRLASAYPDLGDAGGHLSSLSLVVHAVPGGHVVFVANGRDGVLYRDVRGTWHRHGMPDSGEGCCFYDPPPRIGGDTERPDPTVPVGAAAAGAILLVGLAIAVRRRRWRALPVVATVAALGGVAAGTVAPLGDVGMFPGYFYSGPIVLGIVVGGSIAVNALLVGPPAAAPTRPGPGM